MPCGNGWRELEPTSAACSLSAHEVTLLRAMAAGSTNAQLAALVGRSEKTIRNQLSRLHVRLGARNRTEAVAIYLRMTE